MRQIQRRHTEARRSKGTWRVCAFPGCDRRIESQNLCQGHYRQSRLGQQLRPIRPYRRRGPETVKLGGLRLTPDCADLVESHAREKEFSIGGAIADLLEGLVARPLTPKRRRRPRGG